MNNPYLYLYIDMHKGEIDFRVSGSIVERKLKMSDHRFCENRFRADEFMIRKLLDTVLEMKNVLYSHYPPDSIFSIEKYSKFRNWEELIAKAEGHLK